MKIQESCKKINACTMEEINDCTMEVNAAAREQAPLSLNSVWVISQSTRAPPENGGRDNQIKRSRVCATFISFPRAAANSSVFGPAGQ